jgi:hypothetical protein
MIGASSDSSNASIIANEDRGTGSNQLTASGVCSA